MRQLEQNKQTLYYANYVGEIPVYAYDENGEVITTEIDGVEEPVVESTQVVYSDATEFKANISFNSGETKMAEYGLYDGDYNAIISADKGTLPFDEQTLIWHKTEPTYRDGYVLPEGAEYRVVAIKTSLNEERFILKKREQQSVDETPSA